MLPLVYVLKSVIGEDNQITANAHTHDFSESLTKGLHDSTGLHLIHATEQVFFFTHCLNYLC